MNIINTSFDEIKRIKEKQEKYFYSGSTLDIKFRKKQLKKLLEAIRKYESALSDALWIDLHKSKEEAYLTEISIVICELKNHIKNIKQWSRRKYHATPIKMMPSRCYTQCEPLGNSLIVAPWNYPVQLLLNPLVGAISSGCTAILKPSPYVPHVSLVLANMIKEYFDEEYIAIVQGNRDVNKALFAERFDIIFFTGSPKLGKQVMEAASKNLTPVVLELGGKSPCIIDKDANISIAARRIAWGKTLNAGQTCIAPDYLLILSDVKDSFIVEFEKAMNQLHGKDIAKSKHYVRMVNDDAFNRVASYLSDGNIRYGGIIDASNRYISPTLLDNVAIDSPVMQEEIFGPILPMITFDNYEDVILFINEREKPLALYYFGNNTTGNKILNRVSSGGACINDTIMHIANENIPFGGVGNSGLGQYHGKDSFLAFSHRKSIVITPTFIDLPFRYMPYKMFSFVKKIL